MMAILDLHSVSQMPMNTRLEKLRVKNLLIEMKKGTWERICYSSALQDREREVGEEANWTGVRTVVLENTLESPLDCKEIQPVHPKGDQSWVFIGRTDAEAETPVLWPPQAKS